MTSDSIQWFLSDVGPVPMGLEISNNYCGVMDAFRGLKLIICRDIGLI